MSVERVQFTNVKDGKLIVHIGRDDIPTTRFTVYTKELAKEVRGTLDEFIRGQNVSR